MVDRLDYRRHSLSRLLRDRDDKSYKDNYSRSYNSENIEKILSRTRSIISDFDSGKSYGTLPPRLRLTGSKYSSSYITSSSPGGGVTSRSYKSRSPSYTTSSTSPSLSRRSFISSLPRSISPTPLTNGLGPSRHTLSPSSSRLSSPPRNSRSSPPRRNSSSRVSPARSFRSSPPRRNDRSPPSRQTSITLPSVQESGTAGTSGLPPSSPRILNELSVPKAGSSLNGTDTVDSRVSSRRRSSGTLPSALSSSISNSAKYEKCYNDLLTRINHIKVCNHLVRSVWCECC
uniref:Uncharacterized protein n=1 Tax=Cacopsylla melanoneura TaxID=428564 RepID=A0A8D8Z276_9HEMI